MKKWLKISLIVLIFLLAGIQLFPGSKPEVVLNNPQDIHREVVVPEGVSTTLRVACYDCHSTETRYPWYASMAPVSWWLIDHIEHGSSHLNFSEWASYSEKRKHHKLEEIIEEVEEGKMPLNSYTWVHKEAILTERQVEELANWARSYMGELDPEGL